MKTILALIFAIIRKSKKIKRHKTEIFVDDPQQFQFGVLAAGGKNTKAVRQEDGSYAITWESD